MSMLRVILYAAGILTIILQCTAKLFYDNSSIGYIVEYRSFYFDTTRIYQLNSCV